MLARPLPRLAVVLSACLLVVAGLVPAAGTVALAALAVVGGMLAWDEIRFFRQTPRRLRSRDQLELAAGLGLVALILAAAAVSQLA